MGDRVKLRIRIGERVVDTIALVSTDFETGEPQILVPHAFLVRNGIDFRFFG